MSFDWLYLRFSWTPNFRKHQFYSEQCQVVQNWYDLYSQVLLHLQKAISKLSQVFGWQFSKSCWPFLFNLLICFDFDTPTSFIRRKITKYIIKHSLFFKKENNFNFLKIPSYVQDTLSSFLLLQLLVVPVVVFTYSKYSFPLIFLSKASLYKDCEISSGPPGYLLLILDALWLILGLNVLQILLLSIIEKD